jgi:hypothetical protein
MVVQMNIRKIFFLFGINLTHLVRAFKGLRWLSKDYFIIKKQIRESTDKWPISLFPIMFDRDDNSGVANGQYFYQDIYVAQQIYNNCPEKHIDIGSRVDGFVAQVAVFRKIEVLDIRKLTTKVKNIEFIQCDLMASNHALINSTDSLSCLHAIEHFGLGRYGDSIDLNGHLKGLDNMKNILKNGGFFYFSTQIGQQRIEFNAHRVFSVRYLIDYFKRYYEILNFSYIDDSGDFFENVNLTNILIDNNFGCTLGCGIFILRKL